MTKVFKVGGWGQLNGLAVKIGRTNGFKSWDYIGWDSDKEPQGSIEVTFYEDDRGFYEC